MKKMLYLITLCLSMWPFAKSKADSTNIGNIFGNIDEKRRVVGYGGEFLPPRPVYPMVSPKTFIVTPSLKERFLKRLPSYNSNYSNDYQRDDGEGAQVPQALIAEACENFYEQGLVDEVQLCLENLEVESLENLESLDNTQVIEELMSHGILDEAVISESVQCFDPSFDPTK